MNNLIRYTNTESKLHATKEELEYLSQFRMRPTPFSDKPEPSLIQIESCQIVHHWIDLE
jgi:hypothetical protein